MPGVDLPPNGNEGFERVVARTEALERRPRVYTPDDWTVVSSEIIASAFGGVGGGVKDTAAIGFDPVRFKGKPLFSWGAETPTTPNTVPITVTMRVLSWATETLDGTTYYTGCVFRVEGGGFTGTMTLDWKMEGRSR